MAAREVVSAGFVVYCKKQANIQYLVLKSSKSQTWGPPKGRLDPGETGFDAALRETQEEAGLKKDDLNIKEDFKKAIEYKVRHNRNNRVPRVLKSQEKSGNWFLQISVLKKSGN